MSVKAQLTGTVVSDKMDKTVVVAVERQVRHERLRQDSAQDVEVRRAQRGQRGQGRRHGDIAESRPLSRRKRWVVTQVVAKAPRV